MAHKQILFHAAARRIFSRAAETVESLPERVAKLVAAGEDLSALPGIGEDLAAKVEEIVTTGRLKLLEEVEARRGWLEATDVLNTRPWPELKRLMAR